MGKELKRAVQDRIEAVLFKGRAVLIYGARQVGKSTLLRHLQARDPDGTLYLNCDEPDVRARLADATSTRLGALIGGKRLVLIDEAQRVRDVGLTLKLLVDNFPEQQVVATGSSALELCSNTAEPLTGRKFEFHLHPFSLAELTGRYPALELERLLPERLVWGMYPGIVLSEPTVREAALRELASSYLYKDVLQYQNIRRPEALERLLTALALQLGSEVSLDELSRLLGLGRQTVANYLDLLEKAFVLFPLRAFSRNLRCELARSRKVYFWDVGIRNALIGNFTPVELRNDVGALWENFLIVERRKRHASRGLTPGVFFWRTYQHQEIDFIEDSSGQLRAFEFTWGRRNRKRAPRTFVEAYPAAQYEVVGRDNYQGFVGLNEAEPA